MQDVDWISPLPLITSCSYVLPIKGTNTLKNLIYKLAYLSKALSKRVVFLRLGVSLSP